MTFDNALRLLIVFKLIRANFINYYFIFTFYFQIHLKSMLKVKLCRFGTLISYNEITTKVFLERTGNGYSVVIMYTYRTY